MIIAIICHANSLLFKGELCHHEKTCFLRKDVSSRLSIVKWAEWAKQSDTWWPVLILENYYFCLTTRFCFRATLFLIYLNDLQNGLLTLSVKCLDASILCKAFDKNKPQRDLNNNLSIISGWAFQSKCSSIQIPLNKIMKLIFLGNLTQMTIFLVS